MDEISYKSQLREILSNKITEFFSKKKRCCVYYATQQYDSLYSELTNSLFDFLTKNPLTRNNCVDELIGGIEGNSDIFLPKKEFFDKYTMQIKVLRASLVSAKLTLKHNITDYSGTLKKLINDVDVLRDSMEEDIKNPDSFDNTKWLLRIQNIAIEILEAMELISKKNKDISNAKSYSRIIYS